MSSSANDVQAGFTSITRTNTPSDNPVATLLSGVTIRVSQVNPITNPANNGSGMGLRSRGTSSVQGSSVDNLVEDFIFNTTQSPTSSTASLFLALIGLPDGQYDFRSWHNESAGFAAGTQGTLFDTFVNGVNTNALKRVSGVNGTNVNEANITTNDLQFTVSGSSSVLIEFRARSSGAHRAG